MPVQIVMDTTGDTRHYFDPADEASAARAEAVSPSGPQLE